MFSHCGREPQLEMYVCMFSPCLGRTYKLHIAWLGFEPSLILYGKKLQKCLTFSLLLKFFLLVISSLKLIMDVLALTSQSLMCSLSPLWLTMRHCSIFMNSATSASKFERRETLYFWFLGLRNIVLNNKNPLKSQSMEFKMSLDKK